MAPCDGSNFSCINEWRYLETLPSLPTASSLGLLTRRKMYGPRHIDRRNRRTSDVSSGKCRHTSGRDRNSSDFALSSFQNQSSPPGFPLSAMAKNLLPSSTSIDRYK